MGRGDKSLIAKSRSHDQDGRHAHIWYKTTQKSSSPEPVGRFPRNLVQYSCRDALSVRAYARCAWLRVGDYLHSRVTRDFTRKLRAIFRDHLANAQNRLSNTCDVNQICAIYTI